ncbi:amidohydrolase family protein [soil metagenome]
MAGGTPEPPLASPDRRRLLVVLGYGAVSAVAVGALGPPDRGRAADARNPTAPEPALATEAAEPPSLAGAGPAPGADHRYDLVVSRARIIDPESGFDAVADVGIDGGTITAISHQPLRAAGTTIDGHDRVLAPGFIDVLSDAPNDHGVANKLRDGVTTNLGMHGTGRSAGDHRTAFPDGTVPLHHGAAFDTPFERARLEVGAFEPATAAKLDRLVAEADRQLSEGFIGIDVEPEYTPGTDFEELRRLGEVAADHDLPLFFHGRYSDDDPPGTNADTLAEILAVATETGVGVHVDHITSTGGTFSMERSLATLERARADGLEVSACMYPYDFWATTIGSARFADGWEERFRISYDDLAITGTGERLTAASFDRYRSNEPDLLAAAFAIPEADIRTALRSPLVMVASDAILEPGDRNHPRSSGCFARTLGHYVRDEGVLSLSEALVKMTILPAQRFERGVPAFARKGRLQRGADADLVLFDPTTIADRATLTDPARPSTGVEGVVVSGRVVLGPDCLRSDVRPGRFLTAGAA